MIHVLILEDMPEQSSATKRTIERMFPGAIVETAATLEEAREQILRSLQTKAPFDVVIADVKVPRKAGEGFDAYPEWSEALALCERGALRIVNSAYLAEQQVVDVTSGVQQTPVPKGANSTEKIVALIAGHIIGRAMEKVFGKPDASDAMPFARFADRIRLLWRHLSQADKDAVLRHLDVVERADRPGEVESVGLGGRP